MFQHAGKVCKEGYLRIPSAEKYLNLTLVIGINGVITSFFLIDQNLTDLIVNTHTLLTFGLVFGHVISCPQKHLSVELNVNI